MIEDECKRKRAIVSISLYVMSIMNNLGMSALPLRFLTP
jgi:hypothetical protein